MLVLNYCLALELKSEMYMFPTVAGRRERCGHADRRSKPAREDDASLHRHQAGHRIRGQSLHDGKRLCRNLTYDIVIEFKMKCFNMQTSELIKIVSFRDILST